MAEGIARCGDFPMIWNEQDYAVSMRSGLDCVVFYGLEGNCRQILADHSKAGTAVYVDLGYWGRREGGRWAGFHKIVMNGRHPTSYFRSVKHPHDRIGRFHVGPKPWRENGSHILLAGMGDKGAWAEGYRPEEWERWAIAELRKYTDRPIVYRPKPSWKTAKPIAGTLYSPRDRDVQQDLADCWAVVTHHSNVAVDAIVAGVPAFCWAGVAEPLSLQDLSQIERPYCPGRGAGEENDRAQWMADIAYTQWSIAEMRQGLPWRHLKAERLIGNTHRGSEHGSKS